VIKNCFYRIDIDSCFTLGIAKLFEYWYIVYT